jgi:hypothetical protein
MLKFKKKVVKKADGGVLEDVKRRSARAAAAKLEGLNDLSVNRYAENDQFMRNALSNRVLGTTPGLPSFLQVPPAMGKETEERLKYGTPGPGEAPPAPKQMLSRPGAASLARRKSYSPMIDMPPELMGDLEAPPELASSTPSVTMAPSADLPKLAGNIPKTKSGLKKFMDEYGKFIALGALAGTGGKAGRIAAPILAALPGIIGMMKKKKSSGGEPPKKSEGGAIRKFKGGSMKGNTMDSMLTPKYKKGGDMPKGMSKGKMGKAEGEMPQHKKMAMGKPTPQSTGAKFAKGGAAKYASGGMCKGYGIAKKVRPTGPMN